MRTFLVPIIIRNDFTHTNRFYESHQYVSLFSYDSKYKRKYIGIGGENLMKTFLQALMIEICGGLAEYRWHKV